MRYAADVCENISEPGCLTMHTFNICNFTNKKRFIILFLFLLFLLTLLCGCKQDAPAEEKAHSAVKRSSDVKPAGGNPEQSYSAKDDTGRTLAFKTKPRRIVSVTYGTDEILKTLAGPERIAAYSRHAGDPEISFLKEKGFTMGDTDRLFPVFLISCSKIDFSSIKAPSYNTYHCSGLEPLFIYRSGWDSTDDTYFGVKGGRAADNHGHIDAGSFIYENEGICWAADLGSQDYNSLESRGVNLWSTGQDSQRWDVFRIGAESHNILTVKDKKPIVDVRIPIQEVWEKRSRKGAGMPMTAFYGGDLDSCYRKVWLDKKDDLHVEDFFIGGESALNLIWKMCTEAEAKILGPSAIELKKDGKTRILRLSTKHYASPRIWPTTPRHDYDAANPGTCLVGFEIKNVKPHEKVKVKVSLTLD